ncbi:hypothetical protein ACFQO9_03905 [Chryseobacterium zhengzhouense]|uniref:Uncharacterized protein n=1 Tax=Chryseobacterium zhengzhouense TaxID=1636086 RepID=A0ABW2LW47_9FLAO
MILYSVLFAASFFWHV